MPYLGTMSCQNYLRLSRSLLASSVRSIEASATNSPLTLFEVGWLQAMAVLWAVQCKQTQLQDSVRTWRALYSLGYCVPVKRAYLALWALLVLALLQSKVCKHQQLDIRSESRCTHAALKWHTKGLLGKLPNAISQGRLSNHRVCHKYMATDLCNLNQRAACAHHDNLDVPNHAITVFICYAITLKLPTIKNCSHLPL